MKRLLLVTERFWPEEFIVNDLAAEAARRGYEVTVLTQQPSYPHGRMPRGRRNQFLSRETWKGVHIVRFKTVLGYRESLFYKLLNYLSFAAFGASVALFLPGRFDRVLIYQTGPLTMAVPGLVFGKARRVPVAIWTQDVWPDSVYAYGFKRTSILSHCLDAFVRWVYGSADSILISCKGFARVLGRYTRKSMVYAPNWPLSPFVPSPVTWKAEGVPMFLFAGNIGKVQNLENVIKGYAIASRAPAFSARLRVVGDGSALDSLRQLAKDEGVTVEFPGRIHSSLMDEEYRRADYLVLSLADRPVFRLTVPSKFQMYLSVGKPILCAAEGEVRDLVKSMELGLCADAESPKSISKVFVDMVLASGNASERWGKNAQEAFRDLFDRNRIIDTILKTTETATRS